MRRHHVAMKTAISGMVAAMVAGGVVATTAGCGAPADKPPIPHATPSAGHDVVVATLASAAHLEPADGATPAHGACGRSPDGPVATLALDPAAGSCLVVTAGQELRVVNEPAPGSETVVVHWPGYRDVTLRPGESVRFAGSLGSRLAPGVHDLVQTGPDGVERPTEVWLEP